MRQPPVTDYDPSIFECPTEALARSVILTGDTPQESELRWRKETPHFRADIISRLGIREDHAVLDYGCGIGRLAKQIIRFSGCRVVGVDISDSMRRFAMGHVASDNFSAQSPIELDKSVREGRRFDAAYAVYVLQHCQWPPDDLDRIMAALKPGAPLYVLNSTLRWVPVPGNQWRSDDIDIWALLGEHFDLVEEWPFPANVAHAKEAIGQNACRLYRRRA
ncbi:MAG: class I SAM-dependent methyltransferase [Proteobacteria bacterium]|nr:class I SAM-dependent methyltransferase [Pseudomonadota bacterium]